MLIWQYMSLKYFNFYEVSSTQQRVLQTLWSILFTEDNIILAEIVLQHAEI
jgi:hypothetical protein